MPVIPPLSNKKVDFIKEVVPCMPLVTLRTKLWAIWEAVMIKYCFPSQAPQQPTVIKIITSFDSPCLNRYIIREFINFVRFGAL